MVRKVTGHVSSAVLGRRPGAEYRSIVRAEGAYLYDEQGNKYLDAVGGAGVSILEHGDPRVLGRLADRRSGLSYTYGAFFTNPWQEQLAERLVAMTGLSRGAAVLASGGSEANEVALKLARYAALGRGEAQRTIVLTRDRSYHGNTMAMLRISGRPSWQEPIRAVAHIEHSEVDLPYSFRRPSNAEASDIEHAAAIRDAAERLGPERVLAVMLEPITGSAATAVRPSNDYMRQVRRICDDYGILLVADEVMSGHWRTGQALAMHHFGVRPDIVSMGKSLSSGYAPLAACIVTEDVRDAVASYEAAPLTHGFTFSGNPVSSAIGLIVGELCDEENLYERPARVGRLLYERLVAWAGDEEIVGEVRASGLLLGVEFVADPVAKAPFAADVAFAHRVTERARELGVVIIPGIREGSNVTAADHIQLTPPYILSERHVDQIVDVLSEATQFTKDTWLKGRRHEKP